MSSVVSTEIVELFVFINYLFYYLFYKKLFVLFCILR